MAQINRAAVAFTAFAKATSSMSAPLIASRPPMRCKASRRISTVPPAAAATRDRGSFTLANGYSIWKKYTKAGTSARSARLVQFKRTISLTSPTGGSLQARHQRRQMPRIVHDVRIGKEQERCAAAATPWLNAHIFPDHDGGLGSPRSTCRFGAAAGALRRTIG